MSALRKCRWVWPVVALALGAFLALVVAGPDYGDGRYFDYAVLMPALPFDVVSLSFDQWRISSDGPARELKPLLAAAPSRAPPA